MKNFYPLLLVLILNSSLSAQELLNCGTQKVNDRARENHPEIAAADAEFLAWRKQFISQKLPVSTYTIPVVFHILHKGGAENISNAQIQDAMVILNRDFDGSNVDTAAVEPVFQPLIGDPSIEFKLATIDPFGNCTNGIDRITTVLTDNADDCSKLNQWDPSRYLNIWVAATMNPYVGLTEYTYLPATAAMPAYIPYDGVLILHNYVGSIGTSSIATSRALTHTVGHYLGLSHPGSVCNDEDGISDTPPTDGSITCNPDSSCNPLIHENFQNYMTFSYCSCMFTAGQVSAMHACLNSPVAGRDQLWTPANLAATGVTSPGALCAPKADFTVLRKFGCVSNVFQFMDLTSLGTPATWNWTFTGPGGSSSSGSTNPGMIFSTPGSYTATLSVSNGAGSTSRTRSEYIWVANGMNDLYGPNIYDFENEADFAAKCAIFNPEENGSKWHWTDTASYAGSACVRINAFNTCGYDEDELTSPSYDLSTTTGATFKFWYSSAVTDTSLSNGILKILTSSDCGQNWMLRATISGADMSPAGWHPGSFYPSSAGDWMQFSMAVPGVLQVSNLRFRLQYKNGPGSNNFYVDEMTVDGVLGLEQYNAERSGELYPNPASGFFMYNNKLRNGEKAWLEIFDITGKLMRTQVLQTEQTEISTADLSAGSYLCRIFINGIESDHQKLLLTK